jgi:ureidoglycolate lyase
MKKTKAKELNMENFSKYGMLSNLINPNTVKIGEQPIEFYRDMTSIKMNTQNSVSCSICRVVKRLEVIDTIEYHSYCEEGILPLDSDVYIHVAPATPRNDIPVDRIEVFRVPKGTLVTLKAGVWHYAPYVIDREVANVLIMLPERTYANDCFVYKIPEQQQIQIDL